MESPPECREPLLTVKQVLVDTAVLLGGGLEVAGDELLAVPDFQNKHNTQRQIMNDRLHQAADALPVPCLKPLKHPRAGHMHGDKIMKVLVRTREGVEEVREVDSDWIIPGDVLDDGAVVLELWDELSDDDYLAIGLYD